MAAGQKIFSFGFRGLGFRVQGSGFRVQGSGFRVQGSFRVHRVGIKAWEVPPSTNSLLRTFLYKGEHPKSRRL